MAVFPVRPILIAAALLAAAPLAAAPGDAAPPQPVAHNPVFAVINGRVISTAEYESAFSGLVRQRYYHGNVPAAELAKAREELRVRLVQRVVLVEEATRRGIAPNNELIAAVMQDLDRRFAGDPNWPAQREAVLAEVVEQVSEETRVAALEKSVREAVPVPSDAEVRAFYNARPELFTEPEKIRVSMILLAVDPSSPATSWEATRIEAQAIRQRLLAGADFGELARLHSSQKTEDGDMGYLHRGMLPESVQVVVDGLAIGVISEPLDSLEGVVLTRVDGRQPARKREFADVAERARELLLRERQDQAWKSLVENLVAKADVKFLHRP